MRTVGLLGGMSWQSTLIYYRHINEIVAKRLGGLHSAPLLIASVNFHEIFHLQRQAKWREAADKLADAAVSLERAGASAILVCTNTMHLVAPQIQSALGIPLIHITDATAQEVKAAGIRRVGLLGTRFTMDQDFYKGRLRHIHGLDVVTPAPREAEEISRIIFEELCRGVILEISRRTYTRVIERLAERGAEGVILGCTEIPMLIGESDSPIPVFDTTRIHAASAAEFILSNNSASIALESEPVPVST